MKAVIWTAYGPPEVLKLGELPQPVAERNEVLVKVHVSNIFPGDCELRRLDVEFPFSILVRLFGGVFRPRANAILGQEYAGVVVEAGSDVERFKPGDRIFGANMFGSSGTYAEYRKTKGAADTHIPDNVSDEEAAVATVGGLNALDFLRTAGMSREDGRRKILIIGAGGSIGTMVIQIAKAWGAEVTVVDTTHKLPKLQEIGADHLVDFTREDFTENGESYDVILDIVGKNVPGGTPLLKNLQSLKPDGCFILGNPPFRHLLLRLCRPLFTRKKIRFALAGYKLAELEYLRDLMAAGKVKPVVDRRFPFAEVVQAHHYVESGQRTGNVVLTISEPVG